jgi:hypothetical protein
LARPWRIEYGGAYYHVLSRGNEARDIFFDVERVRLSRGDAAPDKEIPQQKKAQGSIDLMGAAKNALALLGREMSGFARGIGFEGN